MCVGGGGGARGKGTTLMGGVCMTHLHERHLVLSTGPALGHCLGLGQASALCRGPRSLDVLVTAGGGEGHHPRLHELQPHEAGKYTCRVVGAT